MTSDSAEIAALLRSAGSVFAEEEAELLIAEAASDEQLGAMVAKRMSGLPLEQIVGWAEFCGLRVAVEPGVFVPRRRTEYLVELASGLAREGAVVVDLCCGTGAIAAALSHSTRDLRVFAADIDPAAVHCARRNLQADSVFEGDLFDALPSVLAGTIDILLANAPYVPTDAIGTMPPEARLHEAMVALDGGADGVDVQRRIVAGAPGWLAPGGSVLIETSERQSTLTVNLCVAAGLAVTLHHSDDFDSTIVIGTLPSH
jgi:release factor glutamine methyltransferase